MQSAKMKPARARAAYCHVLSGGQVESRHITDETFWRLAWVEGVGACIWHSLNVKRDAFSSEMFRTYIEQPLRAQTAHALILKQANFTMLQQMHKAGISCITLRGQSLAEAMYDPPASRPQMDIDLLVDENDIPSVKRVMVQAGFEPVERHPLLFLREDALLDLHADPLDMERIHAWAHLTPMRTRDFFTHAEQGELAGMPALLVHPRVNLPYLCFHAMKHSFERLIWLWDIALLARKVQEQHQWDAVLEGVREYRLERPCFYALSYAHAHLDAPVPGGMLEQIRPAMGWRERALFSRFMHHESIPFLAERLFARMMPDFRHRLVFWRETIIPREEVRKQIAGEGCVQCQFIRKRLKQLAKALWMLVRETWTMLRLPR